MVGRVLRRGQLRTVIVYKITAPNTADEFLGGYANGKALMMQVFTRECKTRGRPGFEDEGVVLLQDGEEDEDGEGDEDDGGGGGGGGGGHGGGPAGAPAKTAKPKPKKDLTKPTKKDVKRDPPNPLIPGLAGEPTGRRTAAHSAWEEQKKAAIAKLSPEQRAAYDASLKSAVDKGKAASSSKGGGDQSKNDERNAKRRAAAARKREEKAAAEKKVRELAVTVSSDEEPLAGSNNGASASGEGAADASTKKGKGKEKTAPGDETTPPAHTSVPVPAARASAIPPSRREWTDQQTLFVSAISAGTFSYAQAVQLLGALGQTLPDEVVEVLAGREAVASTSTVDTSHRVPVCESPQRPRRKLADTVM